MLESKNVVNDLDALLADDRLPREFETREALSRPTEWRPAPLLPEPIKQPGYEYGWKRVSCLNEADPRNVAANRSEGWEPVRKNEQPQMFIVVDDRSHYRDLIEIGGLLLCKIPAHFLVQRDAHYAGFTAKQIESVDSTLMRENDSRMPLFSERSSTTSRGTR